MTTLATPIIDQDIAREMIEQAFRDFERCGGCGGEMVIVERGSTLTIECASLARMTGFRHALASGLHDSHRLDLPETLTAAA